MSRIPFGLICLCLLCATLVAQDSYESSTARTLRDQIMYNTSRIDNLVLALGEMNRNGTQGVNVVALRVAVVESTITDLRHEIEQLRQVIWALIGIGVSQISAFIWFLVRRRRNGNN